MARHLSMLNLKRTMISMKRTKKPRSDSCPRLTAEDWCIRLNVCFYHHVCSKLRDEIFIDADIRKMNIPFYPSSDHCAKKTLNFTVKNFLTNINDNVHKNRKRCNSNDNAVSNRKIKNCPTILECLQGAQINS